MKKLILAFLGIFFLQMISLAQGISLTWEEICPSKYLNVKSQKVMWYWSDARKQDVQEKNYWVNRKQLFDIELQKCSKVQDEQQREMCFENLRKNEKTTNNEHFNEMAIETQKLINESREIIDESIQKQPSYNLRCNPNDHLNQSIFWHY